MKIGFCVVNYSGKPVEEVCEIAAAHGYDAVELPAYNDNGQLDVPELLKGNNAKKLKKMVEDHGLFISALSNHADSPLIMGPYSAGMDSICPGTKEEKIKFGQESMIRSAQLAAELGVNCVVAFSGMENYGHINDWPEPNGWKYEEEQFAEKWGYVFDKYKEYGVKVAFEPHPNNIVYDIKSTKRLLEVTDYMDKVCKFLSGGNQQKVVLAKWLASECKILFLDEPTRGIDVGAKYEIYLLMDRLVQEGVSIIMISSEMPEVMGVADRVLVMHEGNMSGELSYEEFSEESIMKLASGEKLA